jgi:hypothetical protein
MLALGVYFLGISPAFDCSGSVTVLVRRSPLNTPRASDTVATFGFTRLPLCFTRVRQTAIWRLWLAIVPNLLAKRCSPYSSVQFSSKGCFYSPPHACPRQSARIKTATWRKAKWEEDKRNRGWRQGQPAGHPGASWAASKQNKLTNWPKGYRVRSLTSY